MKYWLLLLSCLIFLRVQALEYVKQYEDAQICVSRVKIMPGEKIGAHYDEHQQMVKALQGGILTRREADGSTTNVEFPTGKWTFRPAETSDKMHEVANETEEPIELITVQLK